MPSYSFGQGSPMKFEISDKLASRYNEAVEQFFKAQTRFNQKFGRTWDPTKEPIQVKWSKKQRKAWNDFAKVLEEQGPFHVNDIMDDFLVKDVALQNAQRVIGNKSPLITTAVAAGVLYVLLRGL